MRAGKFNTEFASVAASLLAKFNGDFAPGVQTGGGSGTLRHAW